MLVTCSPMVIALFDRILHSSSCPKRKGSAGTLSSPPRIGCSARCLSPGLLIGASSVVWEIKMKVVLVSTRATLSFVVLLLRKSIWLMIQKWIDHSGREIMTLLVINYTKSLAGTFISECENVFSKRDVCSNPGYRGSVARESMGWVQRMQIKLTKSRSQCF